MHAQKSFNKDSSLFYQWKTDSCSKQMHAQKKSNYYLHNILREYWEEEHPDQPIHDQRLNIISQHNQEKFIIKQRKAIRKLYYNTQLDNMNIQMECN